MVDQVVEGTTTLTRTLADELLPGVFAAAESFAQGDGYQTQGIEGAAPVSDEQMFWASALYAHHLDAGRELGAWDWFERVLKPQTVPPPQGLGYEDTEYWTKAPKGTASPALGQG